VLATQQLSFFIVETMFGSVIALQNVNFCDSGDGLAPFFLSMMNTVD